MIINIILSLVSGCLLSLAFPKANLFWLAWLALIPFFIALYRAEKLKELLVSGLSFGLIFFGIHLFWIMTLYRFVQMWIVLGWISLVLFQTLFILIFVSTLRFFHSRIIANAFVLALLWTAIEWLRAWGPFGVTGGDLGYSQVQFLPLIQIAAFASVYGVSFLVVFFNASAAMFMFDKRKWRSLAVSLVLIVVATTYGEYVLNVSSRVPRPPSRSMKLALLQPNIDQKDKINPFMVIPIFKIHEEMSQQAMQDKPDVIVWPETAIFSYVLHDRHLSKRIKDLAQKTNAWLVFGTPHYVGDKAYNSVVSISPTGEVVSRYDKQHLVPFGEYLPFKPLLYPFLKRVGYYEAAFNSNPTPQPLKVGDLNVATAVCFESTFPYTIRKRVKNGSDFILLVTNDSWFDDSSALYFHLNTGVFRAIENRKYFIQVGNTGITAVIDPYGRILQKTRTNEQDILTFEIPLS
ncbi:MAG: apolipoprotein N-acyltransferase [Candidatus Margulisiibacteriota bacterium]